MMLTMQGIWTREGLPQVIFLHAQVDQSIGGALLQPISALLTTEAEYIALTKVGKDVSCLSGLVSQLGITQDFKKLKCDCQSAIHSADNQVFMEDQSILK